MGLFTPKWMKNSQATIKLEDQEKLKKAAQQGKNLEVRKTAISRIKENMFLYDMLESAPPEDLTAEQRAVINACLDRLGIRSRELLAKAATQLHPEIRAEARIRLKEQEAYDLLSRCSEEIACELLARISNQNKLLEISQQTDRTVLARNAREKLKTEEAASLHQALEVDAGRQEGKLDPIFKEMTDAGLLEFMNRAQDKYFNPGKAVRYIRNQETVKQIVLSGEYTDRVRREALERINDPAFLERVIRDTGIPQNVLVDAIKKVNDPELFRMVSENEQYPDYVREVALENGAFSEEYFLDLIWNGENFNLRRRSILLLKDQRELEKIRTEIEDQELKKCACERLGHKYEGIEYWDEHSSRGPGYRSHTVKRCRICGYESEDIVEYDS